MHPLNSLLTELADHYDAVLHLHHENGSITYIYQRKAFAKVKKFKVVTITEEGQLTHIDSSDSPEFWLD